MISSRITKMVSTRGATFVLLACLSAALFGGFAGSAYGDGGVYRMTAHGDSASGASRLASLPRGDCLQCHVLHGTDSSPFDFTLWMEDDNNLCFACHPTQTPSGIYPGLFAYQGCVHSTSPSMAWPGPQPAARTEPGASGKCVNCHDPHGRTDVSGLIPSLTFSREENLCLACHDGSPANDNVYSDFQRVYRHPATTVSGKHSADEGSDPSKLGFWPQNNRHSECVDCHNPHVAKSAVFQPSPPDMSPSLLGVSRILVTNGAAGTVPIYTFIPSYDTTTTPAAEYQSCFKCHSSWTTQPTGQRNMAVYLNFNNASYHPVEAQGKNLNIALGAFTSGWSPTSMTYCSDCHKSSSSGLRGPHGSQYQYILAGLYPASTAQRTASSSDLCFLCHFFDTYANDSAPNATKSLSRFNPPTFSKGHTFHVGQQRRHCYSCHDSHGSAQFPHLITIGRNPGLNNYVHAANGGTCYPTCHGSKTYSTNY